MSECNLCSINRLKNKAKKENKILTMIPGTWGMGGMELYIHPKGIDKKLLNKDGDADNPYSVGWVMGISDSCECD